jgi:glycosyltransferase EpsE
MKLSVIMPVYNGMPYVSKAIESILNQTFRDFEFIIIDDGSTDGTADVLHQFYEKDPRIKIFTFNENKGRGYCLAYGVSVAKGELIARMDADDISLPYRFEKQIKYLDENYLDIIGSWVKEIDETGNFKRLIKMPVNHDEIVKAIWSCPFIHPTILAKRESLLKAGNYDPKLRNHQDYELWFRCVMDGLRMGNVPEYLLELRKSSNSLKEKKKNAFLQVKLGLKGCKKLNLGFVAYSGVLFPLLYKFLPLSMISVISHLFSKFDPRKTFISSVW